MASKNKLKSKINLRNRGRKVDLEILQKLKNILKKGVFKRDHLIEYLHLIQDNMGYIDESYMSALAELLKISQTEVYEVATFYHHFDVVKNDEEKPPALTVRVCESVTCAMNGANDLAKNLDSYYKGTVRIQKVPCVGRCDSAPIAVVKFNPVDKASLSSVKKTIDSKKFHPQIPNYIKMDGYIKSNGDMNFNIPIRTMTVENNIGSYPVGGGIVWDSTASEEWEEAQKEKE